MRTPSVLISLVLAAVLALSACGGDDEEEVKASYQAVADAWNAKDVQGLLDRFTDSGLLAVFDASREEALQFLPEFIGEPPFTLRELREVEVSGNTATVEVEASFGQVIELTRDTLVKEDGIWKLDGEENLVPEIPSGATVIDMNLVDFAFVYNPLAVTSGNIAFQVENIGQQPHELAVFRLPSSMSVLEALELPPEQFDVVGVGGSWEPGETTNVIFTGPLDPGRYALVCFLPDITDPEGIPHAFKGMASEFTVP